MLVVVLCPDQNNFVRDCGRVFFPGCLLANDLQLCGHQWQLSNIFIARLAVGFSAKDIPQLQSMQCETQHTVETALSFQCFRIFELGAYVFSSRLRSLCRTDLEF
jgi:hypothetical protein